MEEVFMWLLVAAMVSTICTGDILTTPRACQWLCAKSLMVLVALCVAGSVAIGFYLFIPTLTLALMSQFTGNFQAAMCVFQRSANSADSYGWRHGIIVTSNLTGSDGFFLDCALSLDRRSCVNEHSTPLLCRVFTITSPWSTLNWVVRWICDVQSGKYLDGTCVAATRSTTLHFWVVVVGVPVACALFRIVYVRDLLASARKIENIDISEFLLSDEGTYTPPPEPKLILQASCHYGFVSFINLGGEKVFEVEYCATIKLATLLDEISQKVGRNCDTIDIVSPEGKLLSQVYSQAALSYVELSSFIRDAPVHGQAV